MYENTGVEKVCFRNVETAWQMLDVKNTQHAETLIKKMMKMENIIDVAEKESRTNEREAIFKTVEETGFCI